MATTKKPSVGSTFTTEPTVTRCPPAIAKGADTTAEVLPFKRPAGKGPKTKPRIVAKKAKKRTTKTTAKKATTAKTRKPSKEKTMKKSTKKTAAKKTTGTKRSRVFDPAKKIKVLKKDNPFRSKTVRSKLHAILLRHGGKTVETARAAGTSTRAIERAVDLGLVKIVG